MKPKWRMELEAYFARQVETDGGLRSWLARWDGGPMRGGVSFASPPEPAMAAIESSRAARRVEKALAALDRRDRLVLAAAHAPRPPFGLEHSAWIAAVAEDLVLPILEEEGAERSHRALGRLRDALRMGSAEDARHALELAPLVTAGTVPVLDRLRALRGGRPADRRMLRRVAMLVERIRESALQAFAGAWSAAAAAEREARRERFRLTVEGRR